MTSSADRAIAGDFAETADAVFALLSAACLSKDPDEIWRLRQAARSQLSVCRFLAEHVRRSLTARTAEPACPDNDVRCDLQ